MRYPIGPLEIGPPPGPGRRAELIAELSEAPANLRAAVSGLSRSQLDTPYRLGGWTVVQVVHHLADAHTAWYARTRLALTEDQPVVRTFDEAAWAELPDARNGPVEPSLDLIEGIHGRWVQLFRSLSEEQWKRKMIHPDRGELALDALLQMFVWHLRHHTAHITELRKRLGY